MLDATDFLLVNPWQRGFPLESRPFERLARGAGIPEEEALARLRALKANGVLDRIGPVFRPNVVGASLLAAMAVPPERIDAVARLVSAQPGVNHNYEREHLFNLWFVITGAAEPQVEEALAAIERASALPALRLRLLEEYHIDLGFDLDDHGVPRSARAPASFPPTSAAERRLVAQTAGGLPLVPQPYRALGERLGVAEREVIDALRRMLEDGRMRRLGAVLRHRRLGYRANAMIVWDVPDASVGELGNRLARDPAVTLCYRRSRALPDWPYNLYCMVHGRERRTVLDEVRRMSALHDAERYPCAVLFSSRCFTQRAAAYG